MDFTCKDLSGIEKAIRRHRDRLAQLLDDVDALRRSAAELRITGPNGRVAEVLDLCTERIHTGDAAVGHLGRTTAWNPALRARGSWGDGPIWDGRQQAEGLRPTPAYRGFTRSIRVAR